MNIILYEIKILSQPRVKFASSSTTDAYKNFFDRRLNMMEIATIENTPVIYEFADAKYVYNPDSVILIMPDMVCKSYMNGEKPVTIDSVGMEIDNISFTRHVCKDSASVCGLLTECSDTSTLFIPAYFELGDDYQQFSAMMKSLINHYMKHTTSGFYKCLSIWYELLAFIDSKFRESVMPADNRDMSSYYYVNKARKYILNHIGDKIKISDIAANLNITPNYLSSIFKIGTGKTVIDYINGIRVQKIRELIYNGEKTIPEIIASVGLRDVRYVQKLFKKYYGVSMNRCKQIDHEISLYHQKPWEVESLDYDIFFETVK